MSIYVYLTVFFIASLNACIVFGDGSCDGTDNCLIHPVGCTTDCKKFTWKTSSVAGFVDFEMSRPNVGNNEYLAFAIGPDYEMVDADLYYCTYNGSVTRFGVGAIQAQFSPPTQQLLNASSSTVLGNITHSYSDGNLTCKFTRPYSVTKTISNGATYDFNILNEKYFIMWAQGEIDAEGVLKQHPAKPGRGHTDVLANLSAPTSGSGTFKQNSWTMAVFGWAILLCIQS